MLLPRALDGLLRPTREDLPRSADDRDANVLKLMFELHGPLYADEPGAGHHNMARGQSDTVECMYTEAQM